MHSPVRLHGVVLNKLSTGTTLPFTFIFTRQHDLICDHLWSEHEGWPCTSQKMVQQLISLAPPQKVYNHAVSGKLLLAFASTVIIGSESRGTEDHILLSHDTLSSRCEFVVNRVNFLWCWFSNPHFLCKNFRGECSNPPSDSSVFSCQHSAFSVGSFLFSNDPVCLELIYVRLNSFFLYLEL
jgi:hypothetical protein